MQQENLSLLSIHETRDAWLLNVYGLMATQAWVADRVGLPPGAIVVISHSLGLDPKELDRALMIIGKRHFKVNLDPMGHAPGDPGWQGNPGGAPLRGCDLEGVPGQDRRVPAAPGHPGRGRIGPQPRHLPGAPTGQGRDGPQRRSGVRPGLAVSCQPKPGVWRR